MRGSDQGWAAAVDPHRRLPGDQRLIEQGEKRNEKTKRNKQRRPVNRYELHVQLRAQLAVGIIMPVRQNRQTRGPQLRIDNRIFPNVLHLVQIIQRAAAKSEEANQQDDGGYAIQLGRL